jgi:hypothetical protein
VIPLAPRTTRRSTSAARDRSSPRSAGGGCTGSARRNQPADRQALQVSTAALALGPVLIDDRPRTLDELLQLQAAITRSSGRTARRDNSAHARDGCPLAISEPVADKVNVERGLSREAVARQYAMEISWTARPSLTRYVSIPTSPAGFRAMLCRCPFEVAIASPDS